MPPEIPLPQPEPAPPATQVARRGPVRRYGPTATLLTTGLIGFASLVNPDTAHANGPDHITLKESCEPGQTGIISDKTIPYDAAGGGPFHLRLHTDSRANDGGVPDTVMVRPWPRPGVRGTISLEGQGYYGETTESDAGVTLVSRDRRTSADFNSNPDGVHVIVQCGAQVQPPPRR